MTTLYFIPDKAGKAFIAPVEADTTWMDTSIVDTSGLVRYAEEMLAIHCKDEAFNVRLCRYYRLLRRWLGVHPDCVLSRSFELAHLSTARQMLIWRDELKMAQWDFRYDDSDSRLGALAALEAEETVAGLPDRLLNLVKRCQNSENDTFKNLRIVLNVDRNTLRPLLRLLLEAMEGKGAEVATAEFTPMRGDNLSAVRSLLLSGEKKKITLNTDDDSIRLLYFETAHDELEYLAVCQQDFKANLIVNDRAKETDNRLAAQRKPTSGSKITSRSRVLNLMPLALALYDEHLQITKLVEWFTAPVHPLPRRFRFQLAEAIARSGGYLNRECRDIVDKYINGDYSYHDERDKKLSEAELRRKEAQRRQQREESVRLFVPYLQPGYRTDENAERTLTQLAVWARQRIHTLPDDDDREALATQLAALSDGIEILMLLFSDRDEKFDLGLAGEWVRDIPSEITLPQHPARVGSVFNVSQPGDIAAQTPCIVWANMESGDMPAFECDFLLPAERENIAKNASFWSREDETRYRFLNSIMPFLFAEERIVLMYAGKREGEIIVPHPIVTRLSVQVKNIKKLISCPDTEARRTVEVTTVDNSFSAGEHRFEHAERIRLPQRMSATGLETFTLFPFDFLFERILNYQTAGLSSLPQLHTTLGNVAHASIARLFSPREGESGIGVEEIRKRVKEEYEEVFQDSINECGAIFRLPENRLEMNTLHYQLHGCINSLLDIISANSLRVDACEGHYSKFIDLHGSGIEEGQEDDLHGYLDMKLTDPKGRSVVFDLKWSGSRTYHQSLLENNRSTQLAVYSELLSGEKDVITAYFVMPRGRLISCFPFKGRNVVTVDSINSDDIMEQLVNSFRYRCDQILNGILENGENHPIMELAYGLDSIECNLFPLPGSKDDEEAKGENRFSNFRLFKGL